MKDLKHYLKESTLDDIDVQIENTDKNAENIIKDKIIAWLEDNIMSDFYYDDFEFDFSTTPVTVNYNGDEIEMNNRKIDSLTNEMFQWGKVSGNFICTYNNSLKSLEGGPKEVGGDFYCRNCPSLKSLEGAPEKVGGCFCCAKCLSLKSLKGAPEEVGEYFECSECKSLKSLRGAPKNVGTFFECYKCGKDFTENDVKKVSNVKGKIYC